MKIYLLTLGCAKNRVDSECLAGALKAAGHELVPEVEQAQAAIVNTCGFIRPAVEESIEAILDLEELRQSGALEKIGVVGCLVNRYREGLTSEIPSVDFWAETEDWESVLKSLATPLDGARRRGSLPSTPKYTRYLKISEGCGNRCAYCAIPSIRGPLRSLPVDVIVKEAQQLVGEGARELCVVGQDLTVYGTDNGSGKGLIELLDALESSLPYDIWIRLLYLHPTRVTNKLLERVAAGRQIIPYLDIPVQHGDPEILAHMNRDIKPGALRSIFRTAREINPDFTLRTTCMVGFPGEKKKHFDNLDRLRQRGPLRPHGRLHLLRRGGHARRVHGRAGLRGDEEKTSRRADARAGGNLVRAPAEPSSAASCACSSTGSCPKRASPRDAPSAKRPRSTAS